MFNRSRRKIIISIMGSLILLFATTLTVILLASYQEVRRNNRRMLEQYTEFYSMDPPPKAPEGKSPEGDVPEGERREPPIDVRRDYELSTFYAVVFEEDGTVAAVDNGEKDIYTEEELIRIAEEIRADHKSSGRKGDLTFLVRQKDTYTLVAFIDSTVSESGLQTLLRNVLIVGGAAIIVLFLISWYISGRIIRPLEENDRKQKQFISDASHELKTPVSVISANAELLSRELGANEWLSNIQYENDRMGDLVKQLLDLSRAESAESPMDTVDFSRIVTGEALAFESLAFENEKLLQTEISEGIQLTGNQAQLQQLVSILLDNAVRHAAGKKIALSLKRQAHAAVLSVANESEPIEPDMLEHLFDRFYRVDEARNSDGHHYGLGLSIAKAVAEKHNGTIHVSYENGMISFTVSIPEKK